MGSFDFGAQYQQEPVADGGNLIKWKWFQFYDNPPIRRPGDKIIVSCDTAMSSKNWRATQLALCFRSARRPFSSWMCCASGLNFPICGAAIVFITVGDVREQLRLLIENKGSGMSLIQDLRRDRIRAIAVNPQGDKAMRMNAQTARIEAGAVSLPGERIGWKSFGGRSCHSPLVVITIK